MLRTWIAAHLVYWHIHLMKTVTPLSTEVCYGHSTIRTHTRNALDKHLCALWEVPFFAFIFSPLLSPCKFHIMCTLRVCLKQSMPWSLWLKPPYWRDWSAGALRDELGCASVHGTGLMSFARYKLAFSGCHTGKGTHWDGRPRSVSRAEFKRLQMHADPTE